MNEKLEERILTHEMAIRQQTEAIKQMTEAIEELAENVTALQLTIYGSPII
ncbi:MAG: hypothetical protein HUJ70_14265 [Pseudobutyrivibrio sp.]|nr:hypothetical protein [Pseudobutyrivibrio sp.]